MESYVREFAHIVALMCDGLAVLILAVGSLTALTRVAIHLRAFAAPGAMKFIWLRFASAILLALEFALAADIAETAVAPTLEEIGKLAAIAAIRTALNYFLAKDLKEFREDYGPAGGAPSGQA